MQVFLKASKKRKRKREVEEAFQKKIAEWHIFFLGRMLKKVIQSNNKDVFSGKDERKELVARLRKS